MRDFTAALDRTSAFLDRVGRLHARYRAGQIHVHVPAALLDHERPLDDLVAESLPDSHAALAAAAKSLFYSLPVAFDPSQSIGPYLATADRGPDGEPWRFLDMGALIATHAFGENDPDIVAAVLEHLPYAVGRYAHSEYQTALSLRLKAELARIAPAGAPRSFIVNTGAEAVENAIKSVLLNRVVTAGEKDGGFIISFEGAFHGRTLGSLAVTHRRKARLGFPTFDWPHASFPAEEPRSPKETARREERSLRQIWELLVSGRLPGADKNKEALRRELESIDAFLAETGGDVAAFVAAQRAQLTPDVQRRSRRVAAVLVEPIQGEGGVRMTTARFMRRLRLLTRIYDVPLVFDEVQSGWGAAGRLWAHELFELPAPPDVVIWAKKAQNGVLFVSDELATFFQEEKKFNTTWEGDSVGMVRLLAMLGKLDLEQVQRTGELARAGLESLARDYPELVKNVRGAGVMLAFDVVRADWRDAVRDRAFRRGLVLLPAGERVLRFYPRFDTEPYAIVEAVTLLRAAIDDVVSGRVGAAGAQGPKIRVGVFDCPVEAIEMIDFDAVNFDALRGSIMTVETERYGDVSQYPAGVLTDGRRPLLQLPSETLEATISNPQSIGVALRDRVSGQIVAYALGSPLENHDEEGVGSDPHHGEGNTFYLHAMATLPSVQNQTEIENLLLEHVRERALQLGFEYLSTLIEERVRAVGPAWLRDGDVLLGIDSYLRSGIRFVYVQAPVAGSAGAGAASSRELVSGGSRGGAMAQVQVQTARMWIAGAARDAQGGEVLAVENPATEATLGHVPRARAADVAAAAEAARNAQPAWRRLPGLEKAKLLHDIASHMRSMHRELAVIMTREGGKPMIENLDEIEWTTACFDYYAEIGRHSRGNSIPPSFEHQVNFTVKEPYGVVGAIVPFNYPLLLMAWKVAPALAAGNTVVLKPAEQTPLATLALAPAFEVLPQGVVNIVTGLGEEAGEALVADPRVDMIAFTGSTAVGKRIMRRAADTLKKVNLETSGIDPFIVCDDADVEIAARAAVWARYLNAGQVCTSAKRFYVVDAIADAFVERFVHIAREVRVGDPMHPETDMGPVISQAALQQVQQAIATACGEGARLVCGGGRPAGLERGHFLEPTVLDHVAHGSTPTREEVFGPVAAIVRVRDVDEAIACANDSLYGLGANIYTNNLRHVMRAMEEVKAGTFWVNDPLTDNEAGPFGGMRQSGIGRELGEEGLDAFREPKHVHIDYIQERKSYWFPYAERKWS